MSSDPRLGPNDVDPTEDPRLPWPQELFRRMAALEEIVDRLLGNERELKILRWLLVVGLPAMGAAVAFISRMGSP